MVKPEILEQRPVSIAEVKDVLKKVQIRDEELTFRAGKTQDYVNDVPTPSLTKVKEITKKIKELGIPRFKDEYIIKTIDTMPESAEQLKVILSGYNLTITKESIKKVFDVLDENRP